MPADSQSPMPGSVRHVMGQNATPSGSGMNRTPLWKKLVERFALLVVFAAAVSFLLFALDLQIRDPRINVDFAILYTAGRIVSHANPHRLYDMQLQRQIQEELVHRKEFRPFYHAPFEAWLFVPFANLPFNTAFLLWSACNVLLFVLVLFLLHRTGYTLGTRSLLVWAAAAIPPLASLFLIGQDSLLLTVIFLLAFLALKKSREYTAGFVLGLGLFSFQVILPFVFVFFLRRRFKLIAAFAGSAVLVSAISLATVGWGGIIEYARVIQTVARPAGDQLSGSVTSMVSLRALFEALFHGAVSSHLIFALVLLVTLFLLAWAAWRFSAIANPETRAFDVQFSLCLLVALMASYHLFQYSLSPMIIAAFLMLAYEDAARRAGSLRDYACTMLFLLFAVASIAIGHFHLPQGLVSIVLLGLVVWSSQEAARAAVPNEASAN